MKPAFALVLAALALSPAPALAGDARLVTRAFSADEVVRVEGRTGVQATIALGEAERIDNVAIGDAASWQVTPNKRGNVLFVKPLAPRARTNMTVVTDRRSYYFDLVASPTARALYALRFTYADEPAAPASVPAGGAEEAALVARPPADPAALNFAWERKGPGRLQPQRVYDDGQSTYLTWAAGVPLPAILVRDERGNEGPVNFAVRDGTIVVDGAPDLIVLRAGRDMATLQRKAAPARVAAAGEER